MKFYSKIVTGLYALSEITLVVILLLILTDIIFRTLGYGSWIYTLSIVEYGLLWFCVLAAPKLMLNNNHIVINIFPNKINLQNIIVNTICLLVSLCIAVFSLNVLVDSIITNRLDIRAEELPMWMLIWPLPLSFGLLTIDFANRIFRNS